MSIFGDKVEQSDFDNFKHDMVSRFGVLDTHIQNLARQIEEKTPAEIDEIRAAAVQVASDKSAIRQASEEAVSILGMVSNEKVAVENSLSTLKDEVAKTLQMYETLKANVAELQGLRAELVASRAKTDETVVETVSNLEKSKATLKLADGVPAQIEAAAKLQKECEGLRDNIQGLVDHSLEGKSQIDGVIREIFGQDVKGSDDKVERVEGLREKLKKSFDSAGDDLKKLVDGSKLEVEEVTKQLNTLLPGAMAAGLSAAYEAKAEAEIKSKVWLERQFFLSIVGLLVVSLIPVWVDISLLKDGKSVVDVLKLTPYPLVLPLYFPLLWFAYSTSKKANLAKRLIEEYTHKSVLGKTFSGLSKQIESLPKDDVVRRDLWTRLLYSVLQVSAENPGKLITDYNKADHPLMEAIENSAKAAESIEYLERIPGLGSLAKILAGRIETRAKAQAAKIEEGLEAVEAVAEAVD